MRSHRAGILLAAVIAMCALLQPTSRAVAGQPACGDQVAPIPGAQADVTGGLPVLFTHGIHSDRDHWATPKLEELHSDLRGIPSVSLWTFDYGDVSTHWVTDERIGPSFARAIECLATAAGRKIIVVAHSMGGLATQLAVSQPLPTGGTVADDVAEVVTVGTPYRGSVLLSLAQAGYTADKMANAATIAALKGVLSACRLVGKKCEAHLPFLSDQNSQGLKFDSPQIKALPAWPDDLPVEPVAGNIVYKFKVNLFVYHHESTVAQIGDPVVSVGSATAHRSHADKLVVECSDVGVAKIWEIFTSSCFHGNMKYRSDVQKAIIDVVKRVQAEPRQPTVGTVYYSHYDDSTYETSLLAKTGSAPARVLIPSLPGGGATVSPDGHHLAWTDTTSGPAARLMVADIDGRNARELAQGANIGGLCNLPAWSPDSKQILFQQTATTRTASGRWARIDAGTGAGTVLHAPTGCYPVWSPDGTAIAWYDRGPADSANIRITDADGEHTRFVPFVDGVKDPCFNAVLALSPAGRYAAVDASVPGRRACGDGPGRGEADAGIVIDTATGRSVGPVGPLQSGLFLPDGSLLAAPVHGRTFTLMDPQRTVVARIPDPAIDRDVAILAYDHK